MPLLALACPLVHSTTRESQPLPFRVNITATVSRHSPPREQQPFSVLSRVNTAAGDLQRSASCPGGVARLSGTASLSTHLIYLSPVLSLLPLLILPIHSSFLFLILTPVFSSSSSLSPLFSLCFTRLFLNDMLRSLTVLAGPAELTWRPTGLCPSLTFHTPAQDAHPSLSRCTKELSVRLPIPLTPMH